ncbi:uncharacterized protein EI97DRAFT_466078 [Westerdykella ornata]|uniref:Aminoglycoside phosphotransferase domain-containing protein n=1 Tax=Westerdykella ornata TaxID=318751 RepID=A0A6A6JSL2_WESOR|nr:uncharacterized protein EI97DRAFT_466078 [Westerdykella ornata]KAF2277969.1 hypothetical protein EI97DRAFT_466078 [Westerdykella ornata]
MSAPPSTTEIATTLLAQHGLQLQSLEILQSLWAGYGHVCRVTAIPSPLASEPTAKSQESSTTTPSLSQTPETYIIKLISPPLSPSKHQDEGHIRKLLSYQVEQYFYTYLAHLMPASSIPVANCFSSLTEHNPNGTLTSAMLLTDLARDFPVAGEKRGTLSTRQVYASLDWLSSFHGFWWSRVGDFDREKLVRPPLEEMKGREELRDSDATKGGDVDGVWLNGGYTYLSTRRSEFASLAADEDAEWRDALTMPFPEGSPSSLAEKISRILAPHPHPDQHGPGPTDAYQTLIHGDVKSENLFATRDGGRVAFYDFQYVGLGLGVCDLAKLFTCSVPVEMLVDAGISHSKVLRMQNGERGLLQHYLSNLTKVSGKTYEWDTFVRHWEMALVDWLRFQAGWGFWGNKGWLEARVRSVVGDEEWRGFVERFGRV